MKLLIKVIIISIVIFSCNCNNLENVEDPISLNSLINSDKSNIKTKDLLKALSWEELLLACNSKNGNCEEYEMDSLLIKYSFTRRESLEYITISSYKGEVLEFNKFEVDKSYDKEIKYFKKSLWQEYVNDKLPDLPSEFHLNDIESSDILKSYYELIGLNTSEEYGWICEYSSAGMITEKRSAVLILVEEERIDLLRRLLQFPNIQVRIYAADALLYLNHKKEEKIKFDLAKFRKFEDGKSDNEIMDHWHFKELKKGLMNTSDKELISNLRAQKKEIITCGNSGSYKSYLKYPIDLIGENMIPEIIENYDHLLKRN